MFVRIASALITLASSVLIGYGSQDLFTEFKKPKVATANQFATKTKTSESSSNSGLNSSQTSDKSVSKNEIASANADDEKDLNDKRSGEKSSTIDENLPSTKAVK